MPIHIFLNSLSVNLLFEIGVFRTISMKIVIRAPRDATKISADASLSALASTISSAVTRGHFGVKILRWSMVCKEWIKNFQYLFFYRAVGGCCQNAMAEYGIDGIHPSNTTIAGNILHLNFVRLIWNKNYAIIWCWWYRHVGNIVILVTSSYWRLYCNLRFHYGLGILNAKDIIICKNTDYWCWWHVIDFVTNIANLSPKHWITIIRHQHRCNMLFFIQKTIFSISLTKSNFFDVVFDFFLFSYSASWSYTLVRHLWMDWAEERLTKGISTRRERE